MMTIKLDAHMQKQRKVDSYLTTCTKVRYNCIKEVNLKPKEKNFYKKIYAVTMNITLRTDSLLKNWQKGPNHNLCTGKEAISWVKKKPKETKMIFSRCIS